jgi:hypothetical protein
MSFSVRGVGCPLRIAPVELTAFDGGIRVHRSENQRDDRECGDEEGAEGDDELQRPSESGRAPRP